MAAATDERPPVRVLIAKPGLDGHDRGARMLVRALRDAGFDVAYTGIRRTPEQIAAQAAEHGAELVGISILSGAHMELVPRVLDALQRRGMGEVPVMAGGIIPEADRRALLEMGVVAVHGPGSRTGEIAEAIRATVEARRGR
ncbi:MAG: cobalamin B12-binding domain-containing protein [SAR202 cluster bacterium]|nr:cobalamin B12-binding domain-containing protein [SAR202 cluster bacterium]